MPRLLSCALLAAVSLTSPGFGSTVVSRVDLLGPPSRATIASPDPTQSVVTLRWRALPAAAAYRLVVSAKADLGRPAVQRTRSDRYAAVKGLPEGSYYWRVEALDGAGAIVGISDVAQFSVRIGAP